MGNNSRTRIPFNRVSTVGTEYRYIQQAYDAMRICGDGMFTKRCQHLLEDTLGVHKALLTTSCSHALEMAAILLDIGPGDEVIVPSFTFVSTANAFAMRGAKPVFVDIRPDTLNIDEAALEAAVSPATKAIVVVHYAGVACEMDTILSIARRHRIAVVEDNAHGLFGAYRGRKLGTLGCLATQSFHETKNFSCGEGGALLINDPALISRAEIIREKGTDRSRFFRGEVDKYSWVDIGSSYVPSEILAAVLYAQLENRIAIQDRRRAIWQRYYRMLRDWAEENEVNLPVVPPYCEQTYHIFYLLMPDMSLRDALIQHLRDNDILGVFHYVPLHTSEMGRHFGGFAGQCPISELVSERLIRLPIFAGLTDAEQNRVVDTIFSLELPRTQKAVSVGAA